MKRNKYKSCLLTALLLAVLSAATTAMGQPRNPKTDSRILYHNGPVMVGTPGVYFIWYGNWSAAADDEARTILVDFSTSIGATPYFLINTTYPNAAGGAPSGGLIFAGAQSDVYSRGATLTVSQIQGIIWDQIASGALPLNPNDIYLVASSPDVVDEQPDGSSFCTPGAQPHHGTFVFNGTTVKYGYLGNAARCPMSAGPQFHAINGSQLPTPSGNFRADAMTSTLAALFNVIVTSPLGSDGPTGAWYDRYGLENADKCAGSFGQTYATANGARANMRLGGRDYLIQQNWVNDRRGYCSLALP